MGDIGRRYFVVNSFDGVLTVLGIVMGSFVSGVQNPSVLLSAGIGASLALGISGFSSAYLAEKAEREKDLEEIEEKMLDRISGPLRDEKLKKIPFKISVVNGLSPLISGVVCISPFFLASYGLLDMITTYTASIGLSLFALLFLGYFIGTVGRKSRLISAFKMLFVGIGTVILLYILGLGGF